MRGARVALALALLALPAWAQKAPTGKEATVPQPDAPPRSFVLEYRGANRYVLRDGDPKIEDAPFVYAVAGGANLWFDEFYVTAKNLLVWADGEGTDAGDDEEAVRSAGFPFGVAPPIESQGKPSGAFAEKSDSTVLPLQRVVGNLREVYAEGDVYVRQGKTQVFQGARFYINVIENRSLIVAGEIRTDLDSFSLSANPDTAGQPESARAAAERRRNPPVPIVIRAAEIRGISKGLYEADNAEFTTCTFARPGYHIAMDRLVYEQELEEYGQTGRITGYGNKFMLGNVPLMNLPYFTIRTGVQSPLPLLGFSAGVSSKFGLFLETRWGSVFEDLGNQVNQELGVEGKFSGLWFADVNLYSARGLGLGGGVQYETSDGGDLKYQGVTEFFVINDISGEDEHAAGKRNYAGFRGRFKTQNRMMLPDDWQLDTEVNFVSDRGFLREFKEQEAREEKEPETIAYAKKVDGDAAVTGLVRYRLNDWQTQTEYLPQATYDVISRPLAEFPDFGEYLDQPEPVRLYWTHRSEAAIVRRRVAEDGLEPDSVSDEEGTALRVDDVERLNLPFEFGDVGFDPYFENRLTFWLGDGKEDGSGAFREAMTLGFNANTQYWRTDPDFTSEAWNIHGIRHIVIPTLRYRNTFLSTVAANDLVPYDNVERFDTLHVLVPGLRNRYQTKRMTDRGRETVTFLDVDVQQPFIFENNREDDVDLLGDLHIDVSYKPDLDYYLLRYSQIRTQLDINWNDFGADVFRTEFRTEPGPDFFARVAYSYARRGRVSPTLALDGFPTTKREKDLNAFTVEFGYQATRLWEFVLLKQFDFGGGSKEGGSVGSGETRLILRRKTHDWMFELGIGASGTGIGTGLGFTVTPLAFFKRSERDRFTTALSDGYDLTPLFDEPLYSEGPAVADPGPLPGQR